MEIFALSRLFYQSIKKQYFGLAGSLIICTCFLGLFSKTMENIIVLTHFDQYKRTNLNTFMVKIMKSRSKTGRTFADELKAQLFVASPAFQNCTVMRPYTLFISHFLQLGGAGSNCGSVEFLYKMHFHITLATTRVGSFNSNKCAQIYSCSENLLLINVITF